MDCTFSFCHRFTIERTFHCISFCGSRSLASHQSLNFEGANRWEAPFWPLSTVRVCACVCWCVPACLCVWQCHTIAPMICHLSERCASAAFNAFICHTFMQFTPLCHAQRVGGGAVGGEKGVALHWALSIYWILWLQAFYILNIKQARSTLSTRSTRIYPIFHRVHVHRTRINILVT